MFWWIVFFLRFCLTFSVCSVEPSVQIQILLFIRQVAKVANKPTFGYCFGWTVTHSVSEMSTVSPRWFVQLIRPCKAKVFLWDQPRRGSSPATSLELVFFPPARHPSPPTPSLDHHWVTGFTRRRLGRGQPVAISSQRIFLAAEGWTSSPFEGRHERPCQF